MSRPWMRARDETPKAYDAFCIYRDLGPGRTLSATVQELGRDSGYVRLLEDWSSKYKWVERVHAFDDYLDARRVQASEDRVVRAAAKHASAAEKLIDKGLERLETIDPDDLDAGDVRAFVAEGVKLHRLALGLSTDNTKQEVSGHVSIIADDTARRILADPEATRLACELTERIGARKDDPRPVRDVRERGTVEAGEAPCVPEP